MVDRRLFLKKAAFLAGTAGISFVSGDVLAAITALAASPTVSQFPYVTKDPELWTMNVRSDSKTWRGNDGIDTRNLSAFASAIVEPATDENGPSQPIW